MNPGGCALVEFGIPRQAAPSPWTVSYRDEGVGGGLGFGSGMLGYPCTRRQFESRSSFACVCADGAAGGGAFTGSRCRQAVWAVLNAGEDGSIPGTFWKLRSSGKFGTPCERMQRAKFRMSCWAWAWLALVWPPELD